MTWSILVPSVTSNRLRNGNLFGSAKWVVWWPPPFHSQIPPIQFDSHSRSLDADSCRFHLWVSTYVCPSVHRGSHEYLFYPVLLYSFDVITFAVSVLHVEPSSETSTWASTPHIGWKQRVAIIVGPRPWRPWQIALAKDGQYRVTFLGQTEKKEPGSPWKSINIFVLFVPPKCICHRLKPSKLSFEAWINESNGCHSWHSCDV